MTRLDALTLYTCWLSILSICAYISTQLDRKFRDELRPRFGLIRAREFWMKGTLVIYLCVSHDASNVRAPFLDLYTFDETEREAQDTYEEISDCYRRMLEELGVPFVKGWCVMLYCIGA